MLCQRTTDTMGKRIQDDVRQEVSLNPKKFHSIKTINQSR